MYKEHIVEIEVVSHEIIEHSMIFKEKSRILLHLILTFMLV